MGHESYRHDEKVDGASNRSPGLVLAVLAPLNRLWRNMGSLLRRVLSSISFGLLFFLVVTPLGLLMRAMGRDPLRLRRDSAVKSYWIDRQPPGPTPESLKDQI